MNPMIMRFIVATSLLLFAVFSCASAETGCPQAEEIAPCTCDSDSETTLVCSGMDDAERLRSVFQNSARYTYNTVTIKRSSLQFLPHDMLEVVKVKKMFIDNVTLLQLFDTPPEALGELKYLLISDTKVLRGIIWELLKLLKSVENLVIQHNTVKKLGKDFTKNAPKGLQQLSFYKTETKTIQSGAFNEFPLLQTVEINTCKLEHITRDIFPKPWNGIAINFNINKLTAIPDDMFSQMPNLEEVGLQHNQISTIPESAFQGVELDRLFIVGNPIKCDCRIFWLITNKPSQLYGKCESPKNLHGMYFDDLQPSDMNC